MQYWVYMCGICSVWYIMFSSATSVYFQCCSPVSIMVSIFQHQPQPTRLQNSQKQIFKFEHLEHNIPYSGSLLNIELIFGIFSFFSEFTAGVWAELHADGFPTGSA